MEIDIAAASEYLETEDLLEMVNAGLLDEIDEVIGLCAEVAGLVVGEERVDADGQPLMGSEDFAYMLQSRPGCYIWLGNGGTGAPASTGSNGL